MSVGWNCFNCGYSSTIAVGQYVVDFLPIHRPTETVISWTESETKNEFQTNETIARIEKDLGVDWTKGLSAQEMRKIAFSAKYAVWVPITMELKKQISLPTVRYDITIEEIERLLTLQ